MKKIGVIIGSEQLPIDPKYYKKHKKAFDEVIEELELNGIDELTYDIQIYAIIKKCAPKNIQVVPLWKLEFTKKDIEELDLVYCLYESVYSLRDYGLEGFNKYMRLLNTKKTKIVETLPLQKFVLSKQTYMEFFKKNGIPIMDTIFYNIDNYKKNKGDVTKLHAKIVKNFDGPIFCKPELGAFAVGTKKFNKVTVSSLKSYLNTLVKQGFKKLLIQPYVDEFLKFFEIKTIWINGTFQYAYGQKVTSTDVRDGDVFQSKLDQKLLKVLIKKGKQVMDLVQKKFGTPFLLRIDWGCCLRNDNVCRDYYLNEIEVVPGIIGTDAEDHDCYVRMAQKLIQRLKN